MSETDYRHFVSEVYIILVGVLFVLAISDLVVGVSNDAVNFLNSAIGSKVASRLVIMSVASLGIILGATFSSGMMEVARKGIFTPEMFHFSEIMVIFLAVMLTDIILLDLFNTFGLPTSTTVSIVFELLGASVAVSLLKIFQQGDSITTLSDYLNTETAIIIISGIFLSILIAFTLGMVIQYLSRLLFSFHYAKRLKLVGGAWAGVAITALSYFLVIKGLKGASFIHEAQIAWINEHAISILLISVAVWTVIMYLITYLTHINVLKFVVLLGTFALAMAFAGNDLVNFIGVPIAGFQSFNFWQNSGAAPDGFLMESLSRNVRTPTYMLILAGLIMVFTLWFSKKARSVTETEVNLARQDEGPERFSPNMLSRGIVQTFWGLSNGITSLVPKSWRLKMEANFLQGHEAVRGNQTAFDLVRASVNLTMASIVIAFATSMKLPLSTTYVSFMVAMGSSLADRAWGRDSAVYRVSGVLSVIGGWLLTAIIAFGVSGIFAFFIYYAGIWAVATLLALVVFLVIKGYVHHRKGLKEKAREEAAASVQPESSTKALDHISHNVAEMINAISRIYDRAIEGIINEDQKPIKKVRKRVQELKKQTDTSLQNIYRAIKHLEEPDSLTPRMYLLVYDLLQDLIQSANLVAEKSFDHVTNMHRPLKAKQREQVMGLKGNVITFLKMVIVAVGNANDETLLQVSSVKREIHKTIEDLLMQQSQGIKSGKYSKQNSLLFFSVVLETKDLVAVASRFVKIFARARQQVGESNYLLLKQHYIYEK